jgi:hypothetical protein
MEVGYPPICTAVCMHMCARSNHGPKLVALEEAKQTAASIAVVYQLLLLLLLLLLSCVVECTRPEFNLIHWMFRGGILKISGRHLAMNKFVFRCYGHRRCRRCCRHCRCRHCLSLAKNASLPSLSTLLSSSSPSSARCLMLGNATVLACAAVLVLPRICHCRRCDVVVVIIVVVRTTLDSREGHGARMCGRVGLAENPLVVWPCWSRICGRVGHCFPCRVVFDLSSTWFADQFLPCRAF